MTMLIERHVAATLEGVPDSQRDDTVKEIRAAIDEMVELRMAGGEPESDATEHALNELGDPRRLATSYAERPQHLIGPGWYPRYIELLKQLLTIVVPLVAVVTLVVSIGVDDNPLGDALIDAIGSAASALVYIGFWVTLGFAVAERVADPSGVEAREKPWTVADLPESPKVRQITLGDVVPDVIAMAVVGALAVLTYTEGLGFLVRGASDSIEALPLITPDHGTGWVVGFLALVAFSIVVPIVRYIRGYWARPMALLATIDSVLWIVYIIALAASEQIVNPAVAEQVDEGVNVWPAGGTANTVIAVIVIAISIQSAWGAWAGYREYKQEYLGVERVAREDGQWAV